MSYFGIQSFDQLRHECLAKEILWEDPDFSPEDQILFYHQKPQVSFTWKRPKDMNYGAAQFVIDDRSQFDIVPGRFGNATLVSVLGILYQYRGLFYRAVPADQGFLKEFNYAGVFHFRLLWAGEWTEVIIDDRLPVVNDEMVFAHSEKSCQFWASLLEKAYAKLHGSYEGLKYATSVDMFNELTGGTTEKLVLASMKLENSINIIKGALTQTTIITAITKSEKEVDYGLYPDRHYSLVALDEVEGADGRQEILVKLSPGLGVYKEYNGPWKNESFVKLRHTGILMQGMANVIPINSANNPDTKIVDFGFIFPTYEDAANFNLVKELESLAEEEGYVYNGGLVTFEFPMDSLDRHSNRNRLSKLGR